MTNLAAGSVESCGSMYPVSCANGTKTYETCNVGILGCNKDNGTCPYLFKASASQQWDIIAAIITIAVALVMIAVCLFAMIIIARKMFLSETPVEVIASVTNINNYVSIVLGCLSTMLLGSSSLSESVLNPFLASGIIEIEQVGEV